MPWDGDGMEGGAGRFCVSRRCRWKVLLSLNGVQPGDYGVEKQLKGLGSQEDAARRFC